MMVSEPNIGNNMTAANVSGHRTAKSTTPKRESDMGLVFIGFFVGNAGDEMANDQNQPACGADLFSESTAHANSAAFYC